MPEKKKGVNNGQNLNPELTEEERRRKQEREDQMMKINDLSGLAGDPYQVIRKVYGRDGKLPVENPLKAKSKARENAIAELMFKEYVAGAIENSRRGLDEEVLLSEPNGVEKLRSMYLGEIKKTKTYKYPSESVI